MESHAQSYSGAQICEAVGLDAAMSRAFHGTSSRIGGSASRSSRGDAAADSSAFSDDGREATLEQGATSIIGSTANSTTGIADDRHAPARGARRERRRSYRESAAPERETARFTLRACSTSSTAIPFHRRDGARSECHRFVTGGDVVRLDQQGSARDLAVRHE